MEIICLLELSVKTFAVFRRAMSCQYHLIFLFCGVTAFSVSTKTCGKELVEGTSCTIKLRTKYSEKPTEIKWIHLSSDALIHRKNGKIKTNTLGVTMEKDGSLTFQSVRLNNTGKYKYTAFNNYGTEIGSGEEEINVYAKKPTVMVNCKTDGDATLTCDIGDRTYLTVSWYKEDKIIQNEKNIELFLTSAQVQENKPYSCSVSNHVSNAKSDSITVSCKQRATDESTGPLKRFGFDFWLMVSILASSAAILLLLICILLLSYQRKKHQKDERELRLMNLQTPNPTKNTHKSPDYDYDYESDYESELLF